ncbi:MAG: hypothetical protein IPF92_30855 [Myxococcales bacterium]|nr:hypothetical protein [Myxococcales bacterium]
MIAALAFRPSEVVVAAGAAVLAQLAVVALFLLPPPAPVTVAISDDNARPLAVSITPVALLKKGSQNPGKLPSAWERKAKVSKEETAQPSPHADVDTPPKNPRDAGAVAATDAGPSVATSAEGDGGAGEAGASATLGAAAGSDHGTETDPLKGRAADLYRAQLASWFLAHFQIRGKVPFETLKTLRGEAIVSIGNDRRMGGYSVVGLSGNAAFDAEVEATLARVRASGGELPPPPPNYPDMLGKTLSVGFRCTVRSQCE